MARKIGFSTISIHGRERRKQPYGSLVEPIFQNTTFLLDDLKDLEGIIAGHGFIYTRVGNPTQMILEERMAHLEGGESALAFASGMAAIASTMMTLLKKGDHIISDEVIYSCTHDLFDGFASRLDIDVSYLDLSDPSNLEGAIKENTKLIFFETPANPTMKLVDIKKISNIGREHNLRVIVDNTFATPFIQRPLELGADIVIHAATKYLCGHGDTIGGVLIGDQELVNSVRGGGLKDFGGCISPFNAWLLIRGLKTLGVRMKEHTKNANEVARALEEEESVESVLYPGLPSHPQYELAKEQMKYGGGMLAFLMRSEDDVRRLLGRVKLCSLAVSLGSVETLIEQPYSMTHRGYPEKEKLGIDARLVRLSVGLEDVEDIIADLKDAME
ncbi:MAG: PLP-dependent aspartate aminotransferase family protein [Candidatus Syntrophoarchaeum sp.]|nr:PLP-dependent aspartate aminotransferase family protein [Candidatus Syntrophoarchaeum sp.]